MLLNYDNNIIIAYSLKERIRTPDHYFLHVRTFQETLARHLTLVTNVHYYLTSLTYLTFAKCFLFSVTFCFLCTSFCFLSFRILCILMNNKIHSNYFNLLSGKVMICQYWDKCLLQQPESPGQTANQGFWLVCAIHLNQ